MCVCVFSLDKQRRDWMGGSMRLASLAMAALGLVTATGGAWVVGDSLHAEQMIREVISDDRVMR